MRFLMRFQSFGPCPKHGYFRIVGGGGVGGEEVMQRHACESEFEGKG